MKEAAESKKSPEKSLQGESSDSKPSSKDTGKDFKGPQGSSETRGRQSTHQTAWSKDFGDSESRSRSATPKRRLPEDPNSPPATSNKQMRQTRESESGQTPEDSGEADQQDISSWG